MLTSETSPRENHLVFYVNGKKVVEKSPDPETTLLQYLRQDLRLTGTKLGCGEGGCGACTVMISRYNRHTNTILHYSANACLYPLCSVHGMAVTTVEGIGSTRKGLHPVQERIAKSHGSQCGFCTPGIVMSMYTLLRNSPVPSVEQMERSFDGNLCRCTGYRPILDGFRTFTKECAMGKDCCKNQTTVQNRLTTGQTNGGIQSLHNGLAESSQAEGISSSLFKASDFSVFDPTQEPIFPPELQLSTELDSTAMRFEGERVVWYRPVTLDDLLQLKSTYPQARLVIGNSEIGVETKFKDMHYPVLIAVTHIPELLTIEQTDSGVRFGASTTLSVLESTLQKMVESLPEYKTRIFASIIEMLRWFAGHQIRNVAAVAGNIMTASPISDLNPIFLSAGAILIVQSKDGGRRSISMDRNFFKGYRKTAVEPQEVSISVEIPYTRETEYFYAYKQAQRRDDDIAIVNSGMKVFFEEGSTQIKELALSYGGMAPTTVMATKSMEMAVGRLWEDDLLSDMCTSLAADLPLPPGAPGGMAEYRRTLTTSFFFKFYLTVKLELQKQFESVVKNKVPSSYKSATPHFHRDTSHSLQLYEEVAPGQWGEDPVGRPVPHLSAVKQATGEAVYVDDLPPNSNELYLAIVFSTKAHAKILRVDPSEALHMPGVVDYVSYKDVPGSNMWGPIRHDEALFASDEVTCQGQTIGAIIADTQAHAQRAAKAVCIDYEELDKIITIKDAIKAKSFLEPTASVQKGDLEAGFRAADQILQGEMHIGGQEHFYLETQACLAIPHNEDGEMEIISSTQHVTEGQKVVASALGVPANRVVCKAKRLGGGFGGKESRSSVLAALCAIAAQKCGRAVRCMLDRDEDMCSSGTRHPFLGKYKVGFTKEGKLTALKLEMYSNAGHSLDLSGSVMERALFHFCNCYHIPNVQATGYLCRTNLPSNTAFRGFGAPQAMLICENWMNDVAHELKVSPEHMRQLNLLKEGDFTYYNQELCHYHLPACWRDCHNQSGFDERRREVDLYNSENRWKKRGLSMIPTQFGVSFTSTFMNQGGSLLHVYTDGSVLLTHGGVEMGQGLHTKMIQVASRALGIPASRIHIAETSTDKVPNTSPTAASMGSDINGMAVMEACHKIRERLEPYIATNPKGSWDDWVKSAYFDRVSLSATGFYKVPGIGSDDQNNRGNPFSYFTTGVACSEVEIDCLTGGHTVLRTDIVMDIGTSLNPAIDIGQIEGGFTQGYGLMMMEQQKVMPSGYLLTQGPGNYKIPSFGDVPVVFNVSLLKGASNPRAVYSSKAIGEPPLFLAASVFFAVKDAIMAARADSGLHGNFPLNSPATPERIRMACADQFTQQFPSAEPGSFQPWFVDL